jgi:hypothetical protein
MALMAVIVLLTGAGTAGVKLGVIPLPDQMAQAMRALDGDPSQLGSLHINPIRVIYDSVMRQVSSPQDSNARMECLGFHASPVSIPDFTAVQNLMSKLPAMPNNLGADIAAQNKQFNDRMEDLRTYANNPAAWHGPPPH